jgi:hypothetical protein
MPIPLIPPELQFIDADGHPIAGGTVGTYVPGTTTGKATWSDMEGTAYNSNPVVLDAAGRCKIYGSGDYRLIVQDVYGELVFDAETSSIVSAAMQPVVSAPTIAEAQRLLGIDPNLDALVAAEQARALTAEANLQTQITNEVNRATAQEGALAGQIAAESTSRSTADTNLQNEINAINAEIATFNLGGIRSGTVLTDTSGNATVTFSPAFANTTTAASLGAYDTSYPPAYAQTLALSTSSWTFVVKRVSDDTTMGNLTFGWWATGI